MKKTITDANGTRITFDNKTRQIENTIDKHGFIYDSTGQRTGNVHGHAYIEGIYYD